MTKFLIGILVGMIFAMAAHKYGESADPLEPYKHNLWSGHEKCERAEGPGECALVWEWVK